jgi:hypothetical protein
MNEIIEDVIDILQDYKMYLVAPRKDMLEISLMSNRIDRAISKLLSLTHCECENPDPFEELHCFDPNCFCLGQAYYTGKCGKCGKTISNTKRLMEQS